MRINKLFPFIISALLFLASCSDTQVISTDDPEINKEPVSVQEIGSDTSGKPARIVRSDWQILINEIMTSSSLYYDSTGEACDWIELYNFGQTDIDLSEIRLTDKDKDDGTGISLKGILAAGQYTVVYLSEDSQFRLSEGETVYLSHKDGDILYSVTLPDKLDKDWSYALAGIWSGDSSDKMDPNGFVATTLCTPGYPNTADGYEEYMKEYDRDLGPLVIYEVMNANNKFFEQKKEFYDWVEIKNISSSSVMLSDYYLSDKYSELQRYNLPSQELKAGDTVIIFCSGDDTLKTSLGYHCPFKIADTDRLFISDNSGHISDRMLITDVSYLGSMGRMDGQNGFFYFSDPTPQKQNTNGYRMIAHTPSAGKEPGIYNDVISIDVPLTGDGVIYYTLDGSEPTLTSYIYNGPITLKETTVIRAVSFRSGKIMSDILTLSYFINENHTLPVVSIAGNPDDFFSKEKGIYYGDENDSKANYWNKWERKINMAMFDGSGEQFSIDCGIKISGDGSRVLSKKSFQLKFRSVYGKDSLDYDVFGSGNYTSFKTLKLRVGEDYPYSIFRDELVTTIAGENTEVAYQEYRYCILYINGEYWGIYAFRNKLDENFVASREKTNKKNVTLMGYNGDTDYGSGSEYSSLKKFVTGKDMSNSENYEYVKSVVNIESLIDWCIAEIYTGNRDLGNDRTYKTSTGKWTWVLYDMDWSFYYQANAYFLLIKESNRGTADIVRGLLKNKEFKEEFLTRLGNQLQTVYTPERFAAKCDELSLLLEPEVERNFSKWEGSVKTWRSKVNAMKKFTEERTAEIIQQTKEYFGLSSSQIEQYFGAAAR